MLYYIAKRLFGAILILLVMTLVMFVILQRLVPGNEATVLLGARSATPAQIHALEVKLGMTQPLLIQYWHWLLNFLRGNFGVSPITGLRINSVIAQEAPLSLELGTLSLLLATLIGVPLGVAAAIRNGKRGEWAMRIPFLILFGLPFFISGSLLLLGGAKFFPFLFSAVYIPISVSLVGNFQSMLLPVVGTSLAITALIAQMTRTAMLDVLDRPFILEARASGISERRIAYVHALKAALPTVLALEGFTFGLLIGSLIIVEDVFSLPGLGRGVLTSLGNRDFSELDAQVIVLASAFILGNFVVDLLIPLVDRRILRR